MIELEPLQQEDFGRFLERGIREYAEDHVRNGNWPAEGALERSRKEFEQHARIECRSRWNRGLRPTFDATAARASNQHPQFPALLPS